MKVVDEQRDLKRRKVIDEFYETERSYMEGLELIYEVSTTLSIITLIEALIHVLLEAFPHPHHCIPGYPATTSGS